MSADIPLMSVDFAIGGARGIAIGSTLGGTSDDLMIGDVQPNLRANVPDFGTCQNAAD